MPNSRHMHRIVFLRAQKPPLEVYRISADAQLRLPKLLYLVFFRLVTVLLHPFLICFLSSFLLRWLLNNFTYLKTLKLFSRNEHLLLLQKLKMCVVYPCFWNSLFADNMRNLSSLLFPPEPV